MGLSEAARHSLVKAAKKNEKETGMSVEYNLNGPTGRPIARQIYQDSVDRLTINIIQPPS